MMLITYSCENTQKDDIILLVKFVAPFISSRWDQKSPLLLGYSGGPDSKALLYALLEAKIGPIHVAHVDHGWRKESQKEAVEIQKEIERLGLVFHLKTLEASGSKNKECVARDARFAFFESLFEKIPFQALLLGHHKKDLSETVLKRIFEGAHLPFLSGMLPSSQKGILTIWRPLLQHTKEDIFLFLEQKGLHAITDATNFDPAYLRSRLRLELVPMMEKTFGKSLEPNLCILSHRSSELKEYLDRKILGKEGKQGPFGCFVLVGGMERVEARYLLQKMGVSVSREVLEKTLDQALSCIPHRWITDRIFVDRGIVFFLKTPQPRFEGDLNLKVGRYQRGDWQLEIQEHAGEVEIPCWQQVWSGRFTASVGEGVLSLPKMGENVDTTSWNRAKVPSVLRFQCPALFRDHCLSQDFLSGKLLLENKALFKIHFSICLSI